MDASMQVLINREREATAADFLGEQSVDEPCDRETS
jgi:hypothetical protein